jgi:hypothetical protein
MVKVEPMLFGFPNCPSLQKNSRGQVWERKLFCCLCLIEALSLTSEEMLMKLVVGALQLEEGNNGMEDKWNVKELVEGMMNY